MEVPPLRSPHLQTIIILHGRGSSGSKFGPPLLSHPLSSPLRTPQNAFPHSKFVFPTASTRRAALYKRAPIAQWFDNWDLRHPTDREELQLEGLQETSAFVHRLLKAEIASVGAQNVVLGGLSQGCAAALIAAMLWDGEALGGIVGMCGWLPFRGHMEKIAIGEEEESESADQDYPFEADVEFESEDACGNQAAEGNLPVKAVAWLREELDFRGSVGRVPFREMPLFLGHGVEDERVSIDLGREAKGCMEALGVRVRWREYAALGHWYSGEMLEDMLQFIKEEIHWDVAPEA